MHRPRHRVYARHMAARLVAGLILLVGIGALAAVALGGGDDEVTTASATPSDVPVDDTDTDVESAAPETAEPPVLVAAPDNYGPRKDLVNLDGWLNTEIDSLDELDGKVVLVEMWTFGCFNCKNRIPHTQELYARTSREDLEIVGVHAPEFDFEKEVPRIEQATVELGVTWPVALDTERENFRAWQDGGRRFWPRTYVIDQNGDVRFDHIGEGAYDELDATVDYLLANPPEQTTSS